MNRRDLLKGFVAAGTAAALPPVCVACRGHGSDRCSRKSFRASNASTAAASAWRCWIPATARTSVRGDERFLMCSTFKFLLVAAVLARVDRGEERLDRRIVFDKNALLEYAPVTQQHVGPPGMNIAQLCEAAITLSDNTAAEPAARDDSAAMPVSRTTRTVSAIRSRGWITSSRN